VGVGGWAMIGYVRACSVQLVVSCQRLPRWRSVCLVDMSACTVGLRRCSEWDAAAKASRGEPWHLPLFAPNSMWGSTLFCQCKALSAALSGDTLLEATKRQPVVHMSSVRVWCAFWDLTALAPCTNKAGVRSQTLYAALNPFIHIHHHDGMWHIPTSTYTSQLLFDPVLSTLHPPHTPCCRSVSVVPPAYYTQLAADRGQIPAECRDSLQLGAAGRTRGSSSSSNWQHAEQQC